MEKFYAFYTVTDSGEKIYFKDVEECVVIVKAVSAEEAKKRLVSCVGSEYKEEAKKQIVENIVFSSLYN